MEKPSIVVIGGGTGTYTVLSGLKKYPVNLIAIVSMADDGGSSRLLREEFGVLPPGSVRPAMVALAKADQSLARLFTFRFEEGNLKGHNLGNLLIAALTKQLGSFEKAIEEVSKLLHLEGRVIPATLEDIRLYAELENGEVIEGETNIDIPKHNKELRIKKAWIRPLAKGNPKAFLALKEADLIVIGPGDLFSSIIPNFLVQGMKRAILQARGKKVYVCNIMTKAGETTGFTVKDFTREIEKYLGKGVINYVVVNTKRPASPRIRKYEQERAQFVEYSPKDFQEHSSQIVRKELLRKQGFIRHDPSRLAKLLLFLMKR